MLNGLCSPNRLAKLSLSFLVATFIIFPQIAGQPVLAHNSGVRIDIEKDSFDPVSISIQIGTTVQWRNKEDQPSSITDHSGSFSSGVIPKEGTFSYTFNTPGTYHYMDMHTLSTGTVTVLGAESITTPVTPPTLSPTPTPTQNTASPPVTSALSISDDFFSPVSFSTTAGATVTWTNHGQNTHSVTSTNGLFDSGMVGPGQSFSYTFLSPGTYTYHCIFHGRQNGTIIVTGSATETSITTTPPTTSTTTSTTTTTATQTPITTTAAAGSSIQIGDNLYNPVSFSAAAGVTVTWTNGGSVPHTVTSDSGLFDSGMLKSGQSFSFRLLAPGVYPYHCLFHNGQSGIITITSNSGALAGTAPDTSGTTITITPTVAPAAASTIAPAAMSTVVPAPLAHDVRVGDNLFAPLQMSVATGNTVTWTNGGTFPHTVTSDTGLFDSGMLKSGQNFSFNFLSPGTYAYHCSYHPGQSGTIVVSNVGNPVTLSAMVSPGTPQTIQITPGNPDDGKATPGNQPVTADIPTEGLSSPPPPTILWMEPKLFLALLALLAFLTGGVVVVGVRGNLG